MTASIDRRHADLHAECLRAGAEFDIACVTAPGEFQSLYSERIGDELFERVRDLATSMARYDHHYLWELVSLARYGAHSEHHKRWLELGTADEVQAKLSRANFAVVALNCEHALAACHVLTARIPHRHPVAPAYAATVSYLARAAVLARALEHQTRYERHPWPTLGHYRYLAALEKRHQDVNLAFAPIDGWDLDDIFGRATPTS